MKNKIYINKHKININKRNGFNESVITVFNGKTRKYSNEVIIDGPCKVIYRPDKPLSCGATVWIETEAHVYCEENAEPICEL